MLILQNLCVSVDTLPLLTDVSLTLSPGSVHALMGPNGSGKSTLAATVMGHPRFTVTGGSISLEGNEITHMAPHKRAQQGIFLAFQNPYAIPGVKVFTFLKEAYQAIIGAQVTGTEFTALLNEHLIFLGLESSFMHRGVNEGFSGGEKKRLELLQLLLLKPRVAILDEIDSGLDVDALKLVAKAVAHVREQRPECIVLLISHSPDLVRQLNPDAVHVLKNGRLITSQGTYLFEEIIARGYDAIL